MTQSNGGVNTTSRLTLYPVQNIRGGAIGFYAFDPGNGFSDPQIGSYYRWKVEQVIPGRIPSVRRVVLTYRDLGPVVAAFLLTGTLEVDGKQQVVGGTDGAMAVVNLGSAAPTGKLMTTLVDLQLTAMNIQLSVVVGIGAGPLSIASLVICGNCEAGQQL